MDNIILQLIKDDELTVDFVSLLLEAKSQQIPLHRVCLYLFNIVDNIAKRYNLPFEYINDKIIGSPLRLLKYSFDGVIEKVTINSRVELVTTVYGKLIVKKDEQIDANEMSFLTATIANFLLSDLRIPKCALVKGEQLIEYFEDWDDIRIRDLNKLSNVGSELGVLLAFSLFIGSSDTFLYMTRLIDNIVFGDDLDYELMSPWSNPMINKGNIGVVGIDGYHLSIIDIRPAYDKKQMKIVRTLINNGNFTKKLLSITREYFELENDEFKLLKESFFDNYRRFSRYETLVDELLSWEF